MSMLKHNGIKFIYFCFSNVIFYMSVFKSLLVVLIRPSLSEELYVCSSVLYKNSAFMYSLYVKQLRL